LPPTQQFPIITHGSSRTPPPNERPDASSKRKRTLTRRSSRLGIGSIAAYAVFTGLSRLLHLFTSTGTPYTPDLISDLGSYAFVGGMTATVVISFVYIVQRDWANPDTRSKSRALKTILIGVIATMLSFSVFATLTAVAGMLLH
jgi:hypothetical protein